MIKSFFTVGLAVFLFCSTANAQRVEVSVSLNEAFFDALLESVFHNYGPPEFALASTDINRRDAETQRRGSLFAGFSASRRLGGESAACRETVKILREVDGVRTAVRFREGKVFVPLAFSGAYNPPFIGCVEFSGWAESNVDLEFDQREQRLVGRVRVLNVNLSGSGGVGGTVIARLLQRSIDRKVNPVEIIRLDKLSFAIPIPNSGNLRMRASAVRTEIVGGAVNVHVQYDFLKG